MVYSCSLCTASYRRRFPLIERRQDYQRHPHEGEVSPSKDTKEKYPPRSRYGTISPTSSVGGHGGFVGGGGGGTLSFVRPSTSGTNGNCNDYPPDYSCYSQSEKVIWPWKKHLPEQNVPDGDNDDDRYHDNDDDYDDSHDDTDEEQMDFSSHSTVCEFCGPALPVSTAYLKSYHTHLSPLEE